jgi:hypothetical protein
MLLEELMLTLMLNVNVGDPLVSELLDMDVVPVTL